MGIVRNFTFIVRFLNLNKILTQLLYWIFLHNVFLILVIAIDIEDFMTADFSFLQFIPCPFEAPIPQRILKHKKFRFLKVNPNFVV